MKIIPGKTIVLTRFNGGLLGLVRGIYRDRLEVDTTRGDFVEKPELFLLICQLRKKAGTFLEADMIENIIARNRAAIMAALRRRVLSLVDQNESLREERNELFTKLELAGKQDIS